MTCIFSGAELITVNYETLRTWTIDRQRRYWFPFLRDVASLGYSAVRIVLTLGPQLLVYYLMNISISLSSLRPPCAL